MILCPQSTEHPRGKQCQRLQVSSICCCERPHLPLPGCCQLKRPPDKTEAQWLLSPSPAPFLPGQGKELYRDCRKLLLDPGSKCQHSIQFLRPSPPFPAPVSSPGPLLARRKAPPLDEWRGVCFPGNELRLWQHAPFASPVLPKRPLPPPCHSERLQALLQVEGRRLPLPSGCVDGRGFLIPLLVRVCVLGVL